VLKTIEKPDMNVTVSLNGEVLISRHVDSSYESQHEFRSALDALDLREFIKFDEKNILTIEREGSGDLFYELTTVQYLRKGIIIDHPGKITVNDNESFKAVVTITSEESENVKVESVDLMSPETDGLLLLSSEINATGNEEWTFTFEYLAGDPGEYLIGPFMVSYILDAGERPSAVIRTYFQGIDVIVTAEEEGEGNRGEEEIDGTKSNNEDRNEAVSVVKVISGSPAVKGEVIDVTIMIALPDHLVDALVRVEEALPESFTLEANMDNNWPIELDKGTFTVESQGEPIIEYSYRIISLNEFRGTLPRTLLFQGEELLGYSNLVSIRVIGSDDLALERVYGTHSTSQNEPISVGLHLRAPSGLPYAAVEDILPPGAKILEDTVRKNLDDNILSYTITGDKVVFFINNVDDVNIHYQFVPMLEGDFSVPAAEMYSMYETERRASSGSDFIEVNEAEVKGQEDGSEYHDLAISLPEQELPENITEGETVELVVIIYNFGDENLDNVPVGLYVDDELIWRDSISLTFHSTKIVKIPWNPKRGEHKVAILVDDLSHVEEINEDNNAVEIQLYVKQKDDDESMGSGEIIALMGIALFAMVALSFYSGERTEGVWSLMTTKGWKNIPNSVKKFRKKTSK